MAAISQGSIVKIDNGLVARTSAHDQIRQLKSVVIETANTVDAGDTITVTLGNYGLTTLLGVLGYKHTTDNSVVVTENPTTAVSAGVLTLTVVAGSDNDKRVYVLIGQ